MSEFIISKIAHEIWFRNYFFSAVHTFDCAGHLSPKLEMVIYMNVVDRKNNCKYCVEEKQCQLPFSETLTTLERGHSDVCCPILLETHDGMKYLLS